MRIAGPPRASDERGHDGAADDAAAARAAGRREAARVRDAYARRAADDPRYSWRSPAYVYLMQGVARALLAAIARAHPAPLGAARILEVGCGSGHWLRELVQWGAAPGRVTGLDLQADRLAEARARAAGGVGVVCASAAELPFAAGCFDVVLQVTAFSSILDPAVRAAAARELVRVLAPGGAIVWYDLRMDNPRNPDVHGIGRAELDRLFAGCTVRLRRTTLAPPLARLLAPRAPALADALALLPVLRTHYAGIVRKNAPSAW